jgi:hypothetical protein
MRPFLLVISFLVAHSVNSQIESYRRSLDELAWRACVSAWNHPASQQSAQGEMHAVQLDHRLLTIEE